MSFSIWHLFLILIIVFVLFGAGKLPSVMRDVGKGLRSLKEGLKEGLEDDEIDYEEAEQKIAKKKADNINRLEPKVVEIEHIEENTEIKKKNPNKQSINNGRKKKELETASVRSNSKKDKNEISDIEEI